jgi:Tfp pilus assembly protein PilV
MKLRINLKENDNSKVNGFTFVEVLVSLVLLIFGILFFLLMNSEAIKGNTIGSQTMTANSIAQNTIEWIYSLPNDTTAAGGNYLSAGLHYLDTTTAVKGIVYTPRWTVTYISATGSRKIAVEVSWNEKGIPLPHTLTMNIIKKHGEE